MNIAWLVQTAKDSLLELGEQMPMMFCESTKEGESRPPILDHLFMPGFERIDSDESRMMALFHIGREVGINRQGRDVTGLAFLFESWGIFAEDIDGGDQPMENLEDDPRKREMLTIISLEINMAEQRIQQYVYPIEMIRDGAGNLIDLYTHEREEEHDDMMLLSFAAGWYSSTMPDSMMEEALAEATHDGPIAHLIKQLRKDNKRLKRRYN